MKMKKLFWAAVLLLVSLVAGAQEKELPGKGFKFSVGIGGKYVTDWQEADISPEVGFHYRFDAKNTAGLGLMIDCVSKKEDIFLSYTHDFLRKPSTPYMETRLGLNNFCERSAGAYIGLQAGYRFILGRRIPFRVGATVDFYRVDAIHPEGARTTSIAAGLVLRSEF